MFAHLRSAFLVTVLSVSAAGCAAHRLESTSLSIPAPCGADWPATVTWVRHPDPAERPSLDRWCLGVGAPVVRDAPVPSGTVRRLRIVSWNVHVGGGQLDDLVSALRARTRDAADEGLVLLVQEAYSDDDSVPARVYAPDAVPAAITPKDRTDDIESLAEELGMWLAYVPSMRNGTGDDPEDRGSAILSTEPLSAITAIELPFGSQRRVAVMATVTPRGAPPLRVLSGHFDILRGNRRQAEYLARYLEGQIASGPPLVAGLDTNAAFGRRDPAIGALRRVATLEPCGQGRTSAWVARVDFMFSTLPVETSRTCERIADPHGSDHVPLLLTIDYFARPSS